MIVSVGSIKGGTGKTTISTNLAVMRSRAGKKVLLVDADEQRSTKIWTGQRYALDIPTTFTTIELTGKSIYNELQKMQLDYNDIVIDVGGRETQALRASIAIADVFLIPFKPRSLDIWTLTDIKTVVTEMRQVNPHLKCYAVINQADSKGSDNDAAIHILRDNEEIKCLDVTIGLRKSFANAATDGKGVHELDVLDKKAIKEIETLYNIIYSEYT